MADLQTKDFDTLVQEQATIVQGASSGSLVDFTIGSILRAVVEAYAAVAMWLQGLILQVLSVTRAATSVGLDLDTFMADFGVERLPAISALGQVTFSRFTASAMAVVPIGASVQSADGNQVYLVAADTANPAYSAAQGGYVIAPGAASVTVPVIATIAGAAGNAVAGIVNTLGQAIAGVDTVTNPLPFGGGADAESDAALRARFVSFVASLSKATKGAIEYAVGTVTSTLTCQIVENQARDGSTLPGYFYVVVDDGSGSPPAALIARVWAAVDAVRADTVNFGVFAPIVHPTSVVMTIATDPAFDHAVTASAVQAALTAMLNAVAVGAGVEWSRLIQAAYAASPGVTNVNSTLLNGGTLDLPPQPGTVVKAGTISVT